MDTSGAGTILGFFAMVAFGGLALLGVVASEGHWLSWLVLVAYVLVVVLGLWAYGN